MDRRDTLLHFKSTLDKMVGDFAEELSQQPGAAVVASFDLDDHDSVRQMQASTEQALVYQILALDPEPRHPLYEAVFYVGAKTTSDPGNYDQTFLLTELSAKFDIGSYFDIADWSGDTAPTETSGAVMITACQPSPQSFENSSGIRVLQLSAKVMANG